MRQFVAMVFLCGALLQTQAAVRHHSTRYHVEATAFCLHGMTAAGTRSRTRTAAADPALFPIGTTLSVHDAGLYSGVYLVTDTGPNILGHRIDLRLSTRAEAKRFGRRRVWVRVLKWGTGQLGSAGSANRAAPIR